MSTQLQFAPQANQVFTFAPTIGGTQYNASVTWNAFGQRWYLNLTDLSGNLLLCRPVTASGPQMQATFMWAAPGTATAACVANHNVPIGGVANIVVAGTGSAFDGSQQVLATTATVLTYPLANPGIAQALSGFVNFDLNLVSEVVDTGYLVFRFESMVFEWA